MGNPLKKIHTTVTLLLCLFCLFPSSLSQNYTQSYHLIDSTDESNSYRLNIIIPESLYEYYKEKSHSVHSYFDFSRFVTPISLKPIADCLWEIFTDEEDFINGALMIVHQIPYEETLQSNYPVETLAEGQGDCDLFSFVVASVTKAAGFDVVLLYYEREMHMNIGVHLPNPPQEVRSQAHYVVYGDLRYYVAECTGDNWRDGWRVGECPDSLKNASPEIIDLENLELSDPGQVSASYRALSSSAIYLALSTTTALQGEHITVSGRIEPTLQDETITIYIKTNSLSWEVLGSASTDPDGRFVFHWSASVVGMHSIRASWSGNDSFGAADSNVENAIILSTSLILVLAMCGVLMCVGAVALGLSRRREEEIRPPEPPEIPIETLPKDSYQLRPFL